MKNVNVYHKQALKRGTIRNEDISRMETVVDGYRFIGVSYQHAEPLQNNGKSQKPKVPRALGKIKEQKP